MENAPTILREPPPFPATPRSVDLSPLEFILALIAVITIPALVYALFFAVKCPPWPFRRRHDDDEEVDYQSSRGASTDRESSAKTSNTDTVLGLKYKKEDHVKDIGSECPVCLSVFVDGEEINQLSACRHSFHALCIDMWLKSHANCPICRASVPVKRSTNNNNNNNTNSSSRAPARDDDFHQGLPDSSALV